MHAFVLNGGTAHFRRTQFQIAPFDPVECRMHQNPNPTVLE